MTVTRECPVCWWGYDPARGDEDAAVPPGTPFEALPEGYTCPRCNAPKERFLRPRAEEREADAVAQLVAAYGAIELRMRGLSVHNPRLEVEAVAFRRAALEGDGETLAGVLVTPWFINAVVLGAALPPDGTTRDLDLPAGRLPFAGVRVPGVAHLALSLMSPVTHLADRAAARVFATEAAQALFAPAEHAPAAQTALPRRALFGGLLGG